MRELLEWSVNARTLKLHQTISREHLYTSEGILFTRGMKMENGQIVKDWTSGRTGVVVNRGWSWHDVHWDDGETENDVPGWRLD